MIILFGARRFRRQMGPIALRCSNCGMSPLALLRIATWFTLFFIPIIPLRFRHATVCPNCKRLEYVARAEMDAAQQVTNVGGHQPNPAVTLEAAVNQWAAKQTPATVGAGTQPSRGRRGAGSQAPEGWYPDHSAGVQRFWNGRQWTSITRPAE